MTINAEEVLRLRRKLVQEKFAEQAKLDEEMLDAYLQKALYEVNKAQQKGNDVRPVGTGLAGFMIDQREAVLLGNLFLRVAPRGGQKAERHASDKLEPYLNTTALVLQDQSEVRGSIEQDELIYGRAWSPLMPSPMYWADDELRELIEGDASLEEIEAYRAYNIPIVWRHWSAPDVFPVFNDKGEPRKLIHIHKMDVADIVDRWGEEALPDGVDPDKDGELDVTDYVDDKEIGWVIGLGASAKLAQQWAHHMGCVPVAYFAGGRLPKNRYGYVWKGLLFHARNLLHSMDETMTDIRTNIRDHTIAPPVVTINPKERGALEGWNNKVDWKAGNEQTINLVTGEEASRWPVPQINIDAYQYLSLARSFLDVTSLREGLSGAGPSGQSAVHLTGSNQISKAELQRFYDGLRRGYRKVGELLLRCPVALNAEFGEKFADAITIKPIDRKHGSKEIKVKPEDVRDYYKLVTADIDLNLPINEGAAVQNYSVATKSGAMSKASARERFLNIQNPLEEDDKIAEENLYTAVVTQISQRVMQVAAGRLEQAGAGSPADLAKKAAELPLYAQQVLAESFSPEEQAELANIARGLNNRSRTGRGQQMSDLSGMNTALPEEGTVY